MTPDSTASEEKGGRGYWGFVIWPVVAVMVYVLSAGPVSLLVQKRVLGWDPFVLYRPVWRVAYVTGLSKGFGMYLHLWVPELYDGHGNFIFHIVPD